MRTPQYILYRVNPFGLLAKAFGLLMLLPSVLLHTQNPNLRGGVLAQEVLERAEVHIF